MKSSTSSIFPAFVLAFGISYNTQSLWRAKPVADTTSLIAHLAEEASQPEFHAEGDTFILVRIGKTEYVAELETGKVLREKIANWPSGGTCGDYAEVNISLLDREQRETSQGASQILKFQKGKWKQVALSEGDYACEKLKGIPKSILGCLKVQCN